MKMKKNIKMKDSVGKEYETKKEDNKAENVIENVDIEEKEKGRVKEKYNNHEDKQLLL